MSPLAFVQCVIYAQLSGELDRLSRFGTAHHPPPLDAQASNMTLPDHFAMNGTTTLLDCLHPAQLRNIGGVPLSQALVLLMNGCIAFGLNVVSFSANGKVGALSMTVAGESSGCAVVITILNRGP